MKRITVYSVLAVVSLFFSGLGFAQNPVPFADFETDENGWWPEEHAYDLVWTDETAGPGSLGAIKTGIDPSLPSDSSPESKIVGLLPEGINIDEYNFISFYYKCDSAAYTGSSFFVMPMSEGNATGGGATHTGVMIGDNQWHYEEFRRSEFGGWWGSWSWANSSILVIGVLETAQRGPCTMWYDHIMLFNRSGDGLLLSTEGGPQVVFSSPLDGESVAALGEITVLFNQEVKGVKAEDLLVNGKSATEVSSSDNKRFTFTGFPTPEFPEMTEPGYGTVRVEVKAGSIQSLTGEAFKGYSFSFGYFVFFALPPVAFADFETDDGGWRAEEHAAELIWVSDQTAGSKSSGAISTVIDPSLPADSSPESKILGRLPEGINMGGYEYISFYYMCDSPEYDGGTLFIMPMTEGNASGAGASHSGTMIGDSQWHYEEYHRSEFANWWGTWSWDKTLNLAIGVWETSQRGYCFMWYDHIMLFNEPGQGRIDYVGIRDWSIYE